MRYLISGSLLIVGLIHLLPVTGVLGAARLEGLYGVDFQNPNELLLMRHRALLFGLLGAFLVVAAFVRSLQPAAFVAGLLSMSGFIMLAGSPGAYTPEIRRVFYVDIVGVVLLLAGAVAYWFQKSRV